MNKNQFSRYIKATFSFDSIYLAPILIIGIYNINVDASIWEVVETPYRMASIFDWFPSHLQADLRFRMMLQILFWTSSTLWFLRILPRLCAMTSATVFSLLLGTKFELSSNVTHYTHLTAQLLILYAIVTLVYGKHGFYIEGSYRRFPPWMRSISIAVIGIFFFFAGFSKLMASGVQWVNGVSLQYWVYPWGQDTFMRNLIVNDYRVAWLFQLIVLMIELSAILVILFKQTRVFIGLCLIFILEGFNYTFGYHFYPYMLYIGVFFFPWDSILKISKHNH